MVSPDSRGKACPLSGGNSTYRPVQILEAGSVDAPEGPPPEFRMAPEKVTAELEAAGYQLVATHPFLPRQYFLVFQRKGS